MNEWIMNTYVLMIFFVPSKTHCRGAGKTSFTAHLPPPHPIPIIFLCQPLHVWLPRTSYLATLGFFALYTVFPHMFAHVSIKHSAYSSLASCLFISASLSKLYTTLLPPLHPKNELIHWLTAYLVYLENLQELINSHTNLSRQSECYLRNMRRILWCRNTARFSLYMIYKLKVCIFYVILHAIQLAIILSSVISV